MPNKRNCVVKFVTNLTLFIMRELIIISNSITAGRGDFELQNYTKNKKRWYTLDLNLGPLKLQTTDLQLDQAAKPKRLKWIVMMNNRARLEQLGRLR